MTRLPPSTEPLLWVGRPPFKGRALQFRCADPAQTTHARAVLMRLLEYPAHRPASAFLQCDSAEYLMLEFWGSGAAASALCDAAAAELGLRLDAFDGLPPPCIPDCAAASKP